MIEDKKEVFESWDDLMRIFSELNPEEVLMVGCGPEWNDIEEEKNVEDEKESGVDPRFLAKSVIHIDNYTYGRKDVYKMQERVFGDGDFSAIISGMSGSGKDTNQQVLLENDLEQGRTPIIMDVKLEYPAVVFPQCDPVLRNILLKQKLLGKSHKVKLWIPFINGLEKNKHFRKLLKYKHPNLEVIPFRILEKTLVSDDTKNFALGMTKMQSFKTNIEIKGQSAHYKAVKEEIAQKYMIFDQEDRREDNCNWVYINLDDLTKNKCVNIIGFYFMIQSNTITSISIMIGLVNELLSIAMQERKEVFSIHIPELQIMLPKRIRQLEESVNTLIFRLTVGFLLMRSFYARARINLQNLNRLPEDLFSQSRLLLGRTVNPKDLYILKQNFNFPDRWIRTIQELPVGTFVDVQRKGPRKLFSLIPRSHKARQQEPFMQMLREFNCHPEEFLYETPNYYITDLDLFDEPGKTEFSVGYYRRKVFNWIKNQTVNYPLGIDEEIDHTIAAKVEKEMEEKAEVLQL